MHVDSLPAKEEPPTGGPDPPLDQAAAAISFAQLVTDHWAGVYRLLQTLSGHKHDAEDLTQETFLRAMNRLSDFQPGTNLRAWLLRIATNAFFDDRRKRGRMTTSATAGDAVTTEPAVGERLELAEQSELIRRALARLSETTRLVFHLRATEELSFREIGELAGVSEQAARWHMHQARVKLLEMVGDKLVPGDS